MKHKSPVEIKSILEGVLDLVRNLKPGDNISEIKNQITVRVYNSKIREEGKKQIYQALARKKTVEELQFYIFNSILAYKGLGTISSSEYTKKEND